MHRKKVGRPSNPHPTKAVKITATPKLLAYLDDLKVEEGYGNSRGEIALRLVWRAVEELISRGVLTRRPGSHGSVDF
jgi:hypothetical protein